MPRTIASDDHWGLFKLICCNVNDNAINIDPSMTAFFGTVTRYIPRPDPHRLDEITPKELRRWPTCPLGKRLEYQVAGAGVLLEDVPYSGGDLSQERNLVVCGGAVRKAVGIRCGAISDSMKVSSQAARSIG